MFNNRKLAGILWTMLGAGSVGAAFARATEDTLRFDELHSLSEQDIQFLAWHLPFLLLGVFMLMKEEGS